MAQADGSWLLRKPGKAKELNPWKIYNQDKWQYLKMGDSKEQKNSHEEDQKKIDKSEPVVNGSVSQVWEIPNCAYYR